MALATTFTSTSIFHASTGVTYHFASEVEYGYYLNGDPFVISNGNDIVITSITPDSNSGGRVENGAVLQPDVMGGLGNEESFDSKLSGYNGAYNVDPGHTGSNLTIEAANYPDGTSLVKAVSLPEQDGFTWIKNYSVLTVVSETPPENAFRPPVVGDDKTSYYTLEDLDFSKLQSLPEVDGQRSLDEFDYLHEATFVSWKEGGAVTRDIHPEAYHTGYGDSQSDIYADALMALHSDATGAEKQGLYVSLVQAGIDYAAGVDAGYVFSGQSAHNDEYKLPTVLSAVALNSPELAMLASFPDAFREDVYVQYVTAEDVGTDYLYVNAKNFSPGEGSVYQDVQIGLPEWQFDDLRPDPTLDAAYRSIHWDQVPTTSLGIEMLGDGEGRAVWNNEAYFDYAARLKAMFDVDVSPMGSSHAPSEAQMAFLDAYFDTYSASADLTFRPEAPLGIDVTANGANLDVEMTGTVLPGTSPVTRVDVRYSTDGENWTAIEDFGMYGQISDLEPNTAYYVQARYVSEVGEGPWINNSIDLKNQDVEPILGLSKQDPSYAVELENIAGLEPGYEELADDLVTGVAITGSGPGDGPPAPKSEPEIEPESTPDTEPTTDPQTSVEPDEDPIQDGPRPNSKPETPEVTAQAGSSIFDFLVDFFRSLFGGRDEYSDKEGTINGFDQGVYEAEESYVLADLVPIIEAEQAYAPTDETDEMEFDLDYFAA